MKPMQILFVLKFKVLFNKFKIGIAGFYLVINVQKKTLNMHIINSLRDAAA